MLILRQEHIHVVQLDRDGLSRQRLPWNVDAQRPDVALLHLHEELIGAQTDEIPAATQRVARQLGQPRPSTPDGRLRGSHRSTSSRFRSTLHIASRRSWCVRRSRPMQTAGWRLRSEPPTRAWHGRAAPQPCLRTHTSPSHSARLRLSPSTRCT
jgi:hypothetical protein